MNELHNNRGSALITALLIITLIFAFSSILIVTVLNSSKQTQLSEKQIQATNLAEMGVIYFQEYVHEQVDIAENSVTSYLEIAPEPKPTAEELVQYFCDQFQLSALNPIPITTDTSYQAKISSLSINKSNCNKILVSFTSEGNYQGERKEIMGRFYINNHSTFPGIGGSPRFPEIPGTFTNRCDSLETCNGMSDVLLTGTVSSSKKLSTTVNGLYISGNLAISTTHSELNIGSGNLYVNGSTSIANQSTIKIQNGDGFFKDISGASNAEILINGDAYLFGDVTKFKSNTGNQLFINVTGTVYVLDDSDLPSNYSDYCNQSKSRGICASTYSFISQSPLATIPSEEEIVLDWASDFDAMELEYE